MRKFTAFAALVCLILSTGFRSTTAQEPDLGLADEMTLRSAGLTADNAGLLGFFRDRSQVNVDAEKVQGLIQRLRDSDPVQRDQAAAALVRIGAAAVPALLRAAKDADDTLVAERAERCLAALRPPLAAEISSAAVRMLARRQPANAAEVLLRYLPFADNESVIDEVRTALSRHAYRAGKPDPALVAALREPLPLRRAIAVDALGERGVAQPRDGIKQLLADDNRIVRFRAALALAKAREAQSIPTLIALLTELPPSQGKQAEEFLLALAAEQAPKSPLGETEETRTKCREAWTAWWNATDNPGLLEEIRRRTARPVDNAQVTNLIRQLGNDDFEVRQKAQTALLAMGKTALPALRLAMNDPDLEISTRARNLLLEVDKDAAAQISPVVLRLVALRKPQGAAEALLGFIAHSDEGNLPEEAQEALNAITYATSQPDAAVVKAIADAHPKARAAAAEALCQPGLQHAPNAAYSLLKDPDPEVRMRTALALTTFGDRDSIPVLIALLSELPTERSSAVEDYLLSLAGDRGPKIASSEDSDGRQRRRDAWAAWWNENGAKVEMVAWNRSAEFSTYHGYTLLTLPQTGQRPRVGGRRQDTLAAHGTLEPL